MTKGKIWAVAVDLTKMDLTVFEYTRFMHSILRPAKIHFVHVVKEIKHSPFIPNEYKEGFQRQLVVEKSLQLEIRVKEYFKDSEVDFECHTLLGAPMDEILNFVDNRSIRLVIAGKKKESGGAGIVSERLASNVGCNFMIVPEGFKPKMSRILVTTDFSEHSSLALQKAIEITSLNPSIELSVHHSYKVPMGYSKSGKTFEEFAEIMKSHADTKMNQWLKPNEAEVILTLRNDEPLLNQTMEIVKMNDIDLIIMGSKGQTVASVALLGSHTLKLLKGNDLTPVLIVKMLGENQNLLDAIKRI
ncbi:MAG: nucleotide-binding universal stress UspA family protein [Cyclobacteriaceae bacterium]|jgi:nucleotide-binding universal stress UspA family protein